MDYGMLFTSITGALDLSRALIGERDAQKVAAIQIDLTERILKLQAEFGQVLASVIEKDGAIRALTERVAELERSEAERARYQLAKLGTVGEIFAYRLRAAGELTERADEPPHFLCQPCLDGGKKGVLMLTQFTATCPLCKINMAIAKRPPIDYTPSAATGWKVV